jgi:hypothetical protein
MTAFNALPEIMRNGGGSNLLGLNQDFYPQQMCGTLQELPV